MLSSEQYIINSRYCGNLLWQSGLTPQLPVPIFILPYVSNNTEYVNPIL